MNKALIIVSLLLLTFSATIQAQVYPNYQNQPNPNQGDPNQGYPNQNYSQALYQRKIITYTSMRNWGIGLLITGGIATIGGIALASSGSTTTNNTIIIIITIIQITPAIPAT